MDLDLNQDQTDQSQAVERLFAEASRDCDPVAAAERSWASLIAGGWPSIAIPEARGGYGGSALEAGLIMRAAGRHALVTPFLSSILLGARALAHLPRSADADAALDAALGGHASLSFAHQEGEAINPPVSSVQAVPGPGGWRLVGRKHAVLGACKAAWLVVSASIATPTGAQPGVFLLPARHDGVRMESWQSLRGEDVADLKLEIEVQAGACLLQGEAARELMSRIADEGVICLCWEALGAATALLKHTVEYVTFRRQFGRPISEFQTVQHRLAEMAVLVEEGQAIAELASLKIDTQQRSMMVSAAKVKIGRIARFIAETSVQLHGGIGVTEELYVARYFRLLTAFQATFGTADRHLARYAAATIPARSYAQSAILS
ncbi:acyl-CoA dehydrogenase family protein [Phenylobacterium sp. VNQ135]|uniref:acyl-CoA dehydrogenase family protein n=1 Tax=Phenylobacterium sp. VNQ135 TaxID=3400922 RepID=UPI003C036513